MTIGETKAVSRPPGIVPNGKPSPVIAKEILKLVIHSNGLPAISLSLVLDRQPSAQENIRSIIKSGVLTLEMERGTTTEAAPVYAREADYRLMWGSLVLVTQKSTGTKARVALSANLNRDESIDALNAFENNSSQFEISVLVQIREEISENTVTQWGYTKTVKKDRIKENIITAKLNELIPDNINLDEHIFLVAHKPDDPSRVEPIPRKLTNRPRNRNVPVQTEKQVAVLGNTIASVSVATRPSIIASTVIKPQHFAINNAILLDDIKIYLDENKKPKSLPIVGDPNAAYWIDRRDPKKAWYAPEFIAVELQPNIDPSQSPFLFTYETIGATASGKPALKGKMRFTLEKKAGTKTIEQLAADGITNAEAVKFESITLAVLTPFVDETDGKPRQHSFTPVIVQQDDNKIIAEVEFLNDWVRLAYGAMAIENYQSQPVQIQINYTFSCYVVLKDNDLDIVFGAKTMMTPVLYTATQLAKPVKSAYINAAALKYVHPLSEVKFNKEKRAAKKATAVAALAARPYHVANNSMIKPQLNLTAELIGTVNKVKYSMRTQLCQKTATLTYTCNKFGNFYREIKDGEAVSIGCQDAFKLGEIKYKQYEEIAELRDEYFQVYRSLCQPGYFVLVPKNFSITRRETGEPDAYRPLIFLNALIDPQTPANNKVELRITLQPDIPEYKRIELAEKLKALHPSPVVTYPTDIAAESVVFNWALDPSIAANCQTDIADAGGPFISTYLVMDLANWQLMRSVLQKPGLNGSVTIKLSDGTEMISNLGIKLDEIRGPWGMGPLEMSYSNGQITITNKTERTIDISELVKYTGAAIAEKIPVETSLPAGQSHTVTASDGMTAIYTYPLGDPVAIEETRSFVEEIYSNVIFINLLNFDNYKLTQLDIEAVIKNIEGTHKGKLTEDIRVVDFDYVLPLTTYLEEHVVQFKVTKIFNDKPAETTGWIEWDLNRGPVSLTHDVLSL